MLDNRDIVNVLLHEYNFLREDIRMLNGQAMRLIPLVISSLTVALWYATTNPIVFVLIPFIALIFACYLFMLRSVMYVFESHVERLEKKINDLIAPGSQWLSFETKYRHKEFTFFTEPGMPFFFVLTISLTLIYFISVIEGFKYLNGQGNNYSYLFLLFCICAFIGGAMQYTRTVFLLKKLRYAEEVKDPKCNSRRHKKMSLTNRQISYIVHWIKLILLVEVFILISGAYAWIIFSLISVSFFIALLLRIANKYPGNPEPLFLDILSGLLAVISAVVSYFVSVTVSFFVLKVSFPFIIVIPHFAYIIINKNLPPPRNKKTQ